MEKVNNSLEYEPLVPCTVCSRRFHEICILWNKAMNKPFVCPNCRIKPPESSMLTASSMPCRKSGNNSQLQSWRAPS